MSNRPRVALLVETSTTWGAGIVRGVMDYANEHGPWLIHLEPRGRYEKLTIPVGWSGEGLVARVTSQRLADQIAEAGVPAVNVSWYTIGDSPLPRCTSDERMTGRIAADHFLSRGFKHFAYCGPLHRPDYEDAVCDSFVTALDVEGYSCDIYRWRNVGSDGRQWDERLSHLCDWLESLPKPVGLLTWNAVRGRQITEACRHAGIGVPEQVAVLGGERDELMSDASSPPLSTIDQSEYRVGQEAAKLLESLMKGDKPPRKPIVIPPGGVIERQSTDTLAIDDVQVAAALRYIHEHAHQPIQVEDVLDHVPLSRRLLEQRFKKLLDRSPAAEIRRVHLERAKRLLVETDLPIPRVAGASGFNQPEVFTRAFSKAFGMPPSTYRKVNRAR